MVCEHNLGELIYGTLASVLWYSTLDLIISCYKMDWALLN